MTETVAQASGGPPAATSAGPLGVGPLVPDPRRVRRFFATLLVLGLALIWAVFGYSWHVLRSGAEEALQARLDSEVVLLEDHASRTLDAVKARLGSLAALTSPATLRSGQLGAARLAELIAGDPLLRSVSLVDDQDRVVASSNPAHLGLKLPAQVLPPHTRQPEAPELMLGGAHPYRDLSGLAAGRAAEDVQLWLATLDVLMEGRVYHWLAAVNPEFYANFWSRVNEEPSIEVALHSYQGARIVRDRPEWPEPVGMGARLVQALQAGDRGRFDFGQGDRLTVVYRASSVHPAVLTVSADRASLWATQRPQQLRMGALALGASLLLLVAISLQVRAYLRYEGAQTELRNQMRALGAHVMVSESTPDGDIVAVNPAYLLHTGYTEAELLGRNHRVFSSGHHPPEFYTRLWATVKGGTIWKGIFRNRAKNGSLFWVSSTIVPFTDAWGRVTRMVALYTDIQDAMVLAEKLDFERRQRLDLAALNRTLLTEANTDALTGLANRRGFDRFASHALEPTRSFDQPTALLMLDLDHFKLVNDTHGHAAGDAVLRELARRWQRQVRASDLITRLGGEEFLVLLPNTTLAQAVEVAEKLRLVTSSLPVALGPEVDGPALAVTVSVGVTGLDSVRAEEIHTLLQAADTALYEAKHGGRNRVAIWAAER
jgi:diguanylate cyclase (GGDEF)-like protein/PAS domain S-box-containing protein